MQVVVRPSGPISMQFLSSFSKRPSNSTIKSIIQYHDVKMRAKGGLTAKVVREPSVDLGVRQTVRKVHVRVLLSTSNHSTDINITKLDGFCRREGVCEERHGSLCRVLRTSGRMHAAQSPSSRGSPSDSDFTFKNLSETGKIGVKEGLTAKVGVRPRAHFGLSLKDNHVQFNTYTAI